jgi:hypothetical protein
MKIVGDEFIKGMEIDPTRASKFTGPTEVTTFADMEGSPMITSGHRQDSGRLTA